MPHTFSSIAEQIAELSDEEALKLLAKYPMTGGEHDDDSDDDEEEEDDTTTDEDDDDGNPPGKKGKSSKADEKSKGKLYTKEELDAIVTTAVTDRLRRADRSKSRDSAKDKGEFETLAADLQKEIDEEWKPQTAKVEALEAQVEELSGVVDEQIEAILATLPKDLQDLDLGTDEGSVKRLRWLVIKVQPKAKALKVDEEEGTLRRRGNTASPLPKDKQGKDDKRVIDAPVNRKRF